MKIAGISFPEPLLTALRDGRLVVFAGAGVSMGHPANLPSFSQLCDLVAVGTHEVRQTGEPEDRFLGRLHAAGVNVHALAAEVLTQGNPLPTDLHRHLLRLYPTERQVRIITTNFDRLFESATADVLDSSPDVFSAPALPLGHKFEGIVHVHGVVSRADDTVLTDADFGRAYLTEGWARRFLVDVFRHFTVLFVGYSHEDVIVRYLARALPQSEAGKRFVLTHAEDEPQKWNILGIEPIPYPQANRNDFTALYDGVRRLADMVRSSILDRQREISELAKNPPPIGEEEIDAIEDALNSPVTTRFFTGEARSPEWIEWLDKRKHFDPLFGQGEFNEVHDLLSIWLAQHYAISHADKLFLLIGKRGMKLSAWVWFILVRHICANDDIAVDKGVLARWVSIWVATFPGISTGSHSALLWIGSRCAKEGLLDSLLQVFDLTATSRLDIKEGLGRVLGEAESETAINLELPLVGEDYVLSQLWKKGLSPHLGTVAEPLMALVVRRLEARHSCRKVWQRETSKYDADSLHRSAIEQHEQDSHHDPVDILIDATRDSLEFVASHPEMTAKANYWFETLGASEAPLLRRLAIHGLAFRRNLTANEKLDELIRSGLHDFAAHHELFRSVRHIYPNADSDARRRTIAAVLTYTWPHDEDPEKERRTARHHYDWLLWLHESAPDCVQTKDALDTVLAAYPEFKPAEHPDMTHWMTSGWVAPKSPWTVEELLAKPAAEWLNDLLSYQSADIWGAGRQGLILTIVETAKKEIDWGLNLARSLVTAERWESDIWNGLLGAWSTAKLDESRLQALLAFLNCAPLRSSHSREIADLLFALVKHDNKPVLGHVLSQFNAVAQSLWEEMDNTNLPAKNDDWLQIAINSTPGILAEFWLYSLSIWRKQQESPPLSLDATYDRALSTLVGDQTRRGRFARCIFCSQLAFLSTADEDWTRQRLLPLFDPDNGIDDFQAAWDGFLAWGNLNPVVAKLLEVPFVRAIRHIDNTPDRRHRFVGYYVSMLIYFVPNPLDEWIPELFESGSMEMREHFNWSIQHQLRGLSDERRIELWNNWLKRYWENRLHGRPKPLEPREIEGMLDWLPHLKPVFPEAVELAITMPSGPLQHGSVLYELAHSEFDFAAAYPETLAHLLVRLGEFEVQPLMWNDGRQLIDKLLQGEVSLALKEKLRELIAKLGL